MTVTTNTSTVAPGSVVSNFTWYAGPAPDDGAPPAPVPARPLPPRPPTLPPREAAVSWDHAGAW